MSKLGGGLWLDDIDPNDENSGVPTDLRKLTSTKPKESSPLSTSRPAGAAVREGRPSQGMKICLNMIVRNEAAILEKCLASVPADYYVIGDTGSTDGTQAIIKSHFDARGIAGEIHEFPFRDFSQARNEALNRARASAGVFDYILLTDADMELVVVDPDWKKSLRFPVCSARQTNSISYYNTRLFHRSIEAHYVCKTHEFLSTPIGSQPIESIWFADHANGSSRVEKTERDLRLLKEELAEKPNDQRSLFYIAQTYKDLGRWYDALSYYTKRIAAGGFPEEVWYSVYMSSICYKNLNKESQFIAKALEAFEMRPTRAESLLPLAKHYRETGKNELALMVSDRASEIEYPKGDQLFVEDFVYEHAFDNEIAIAGFYSKNKRLRQRGYDECMHLSACPNAPEDMQKQSLNNSMFYAKSAIELFPSFKAHELTPPPTGQPFLTPGYTPTNPSVAVHNGKVYCILRTVNYTMDEHGRYHMPSDGVIRTENHLCAINPDTFEIQSTNLLLPHAGDRNEFPVRGYEDCRLFWWQDEWWCSATVRDRHPQGQCEIALFTLKDGKEHIFHSDSTRVEDRHQKNWMPFVSSDNTLHFVYSCDPAIVFQVDPVTFQLQTVSLDDGLSGFDLSQLRGGSQCVPYGDGWLCLTHESFQGSGKRRYLHRFVEFDKAFSVSRISDLFHFVHSGVEFCAGLALHGENLLVSFGVEDRQAFIARVALSDIQQHLRKSSEAAPVAPKAQ
jgi:glycosyltransferase involved in cell wall biosynthesis/predicted GH43/DUF377 family glycosyl hydrolase